MHANRPPLTGEYLCRQVDDKHVSFAAVCASLGLNEVVGKRLLEAGRVARKARQMVEQQKEGKHG